MKLTSLHCLCLAATAPLTALVNLSATPPATEVEIRPAVECRVRGGLPNVLAKMKAGKEVRIGYLGGSITAAPGWRVKSLKWLQKQHPTAKLSEINAAIGGTGSDLGVFRVQHDALQFKPDLLFVEFAVNDGGADPVQIVRGMEGIVRQTWKADPTTDICFVYTVSEPFLADLKAGRCSRSASTMETVADHYQIPSIHLGIVAAAMEKEGKMTWKAPKPKSPSLQDSPVVFSEDGVHPLVETGHELYLQAIQRSMAKIDGTGKPGAHAVAAPLRADNWENAKLVAITQEMLTGGWKALDPASDPRAKSFSNRLPGMWKAEKAGATLEFKMRGPVASAYDLVGPDGGMLSIQIDDKPARKQPKIDGYCTYHRLAKTTLFSEGDANAIHHVKVTLTDETPDKAKILFEKNRPDMENNPAKYADNVWHVGGLLIIGDLVK